MGSVTTFPSLFFEYASTFVKITERQSMRANSFVLTRYLFFFYPSSPFQISREGRGTMPQLKSLAPGFELESLVYQVVRQCIWLFLPTRRIPSPDWLSYL